MPWAITHIHLLPSVARLISLEGSGLMCVRMLYWFFFVGVEVREIDSLLIEWPSVWVDHYVFLDTRII